MEWSKYNLLFTDKGENHYYLYNTVSGFFVELPKSIYETLLNFEHEDFSLLSYELLKMFKLKGIIVEDGALEFMKLKTGQRAARFDLNKMIVDIICENSEKANIFGAEYKEIEDGIFNFITTHDKVKKVVLNFYASDFNFVTSANSLHERLKRRSYDSIDYVITVELSVLAKTNLRDIVRNEALRVNILLSDDIISHVNVSHVKNAIDMLIHDKKNVRVILVNHILPLMNIYKYLMSIYSAKHEHVNFVDHNQFNGCYVGHKFVASSKMPFAPFRECIATRANGFVIKPDGTIFKCWDDAINNVDNMIGSVIDKTRKNIKNYLTYVAIKDGFEEANCVSCKLLPVCGGGCPKKRIKFGSGGKEFYCGIKEVGIESFLQNDLIER